MAFFIRRPTALASLFASLSLLLVPSCSSSDDTSNPQPSDVGVDAGAQTDADITSDDVVVRFVNRWGHSDDAPVERPSRFGTYSATIVAIVDGKDTTFQPRTRDDGALVFTGVPRAPYILESRVARTAAPADDPVYLVRYPIDGRRNVELGSDYWARPDATVMTDDTKLALTVQAPRGIVDGDTFSWIGLRSYFYRETRFVDQDDSGVQNLPADGATSAQDWTFDSSALSMPYGEEASGLPSADANDDLSIVQGRTETKTTPVDVTDPLSRFDPWRSISSTSVIGVLHAASPDFANGKTNTVTGTLDAPPKTETFTIDFHGTTFDVVREALDAPDPITQSTVRITMSQEAGAGPTVYTSVAPTSWTFSASAVGRPADLGCFPYPTSTACDPDACAIGCENARHGYVHPGELSKFIYEGPRVYDTGMRDFYSVDYTFYSEVKLPDGSRRYLSGGVADSFPRTTSEPSFSLEVGPPSAITIDGSTIPWDDTISSIPDDHAPVVAFNPATHGAPEHHRVYLIDLTPDLGKDPYDARSSSTVAMIITRESSVSIPKEQLRSGHTYYVRVMASKEGWTIGEPAPRTSIYRTSIYSAPFVFGSAPPAQ